MKLAMAATVALTSACTNSPEPDVGASVNELAAGYCAEATTYDPSLDCAISSDGPNTKIEDCFVPQLGRSIEMIALFDGPNAYGGAVIHESFDGCITGTIRAALWCDDFPYGDPRNDEHPPLAPTDFKDFTALSSPSQTPIIELDCGDAYPQWLETRLFIDTFFRLDPGPD
jgi:hypothetical protein